MIYSSYFHQPTKEEKQFLEVKGRMKFAANKWALGSYAFFRFPYAHELAGKLVNRGTRLFQKTESPKSLRKAAECFREAATLQDSTAIKGQNNAQAQTLCEMANELESATRSEKTASAHLYAAQTHFEAALSFCAEPSEVHANDALRAADGFCSAATTFCAHGLHSREESARKGEITSLSTAISILRRAGKHDEAEKYVQRLTDCSSALNGLRTNQK